MAENKHTPGAKLPKSEEATKKMQELTGKIKGVGGKVPSGLIMAQYGLNALGGVIVSLSKIDEDSFDIVQDLKKQAKGKIIQKVKGEIPTEPEIREKLKGHSCDLEVIKAIKITKETLESILGKGKRTVESVLKRLQKLKKKIDKTTKTITIITIILGVFRDLISVLQILAAVAQLSLAFFSGLFSAALLEHKTVKIIDKVSALVLKYSPAIKVYTDYLLKILGKVMILFNIIPLIIATVKELLNTITGLIDLIAKLFADLIKGCIPEGDMIIESNDGTYTIDPSKLQNFLDSNLDHGNNLNIPGIPSRHGDYIHDDSEKQHRIYRPKIGVAKVSSAIQKEQPKPIGYHTPGTPAYLNRFRPGGDKEHDPKPTGWWTPGHQNYHKK